MNTVFRVYSPEECGSDGYPRVWNRNDGSLDDLILEMMADGDGGSLAPHGMKAGIKDIVRAQANHRCIRCFHPFIVGKSGVMEGPHANAKALAAELGADVEMLDFGIEDMVADGKLHLPMNAKRTNWSPCDAICRHGGPVRSRSSYGIGWVDVAEFKEGRVAGDLVREVEEDIGGKSPYVQAAWRILTVHHLNGIKADLRWWNLAALDQRCHLFIQRKVTMDQPWPWQHTAWFRPYAAGFYAAKYLKEDLNLDETMARLDELLEIGCREESVERMPV